MQDDKPKAFSIKAYFDDLQNRISFLAELHVMGRKDEALMLCCCYIEALGSRESDEPKNKAKNYCGILTEQGGNELWRLIHPKQLKNLLSSKKLFNDILNVLEPLVDAYGKQLIEPHEVLDCFNPHINEEQRNWLQNNIFKGSMASISYERIRSELVHDISGGSISFGETVCNGKQVPDIDFELLYASLLKIVSASQEKSISTNKWWFEQ